MKKAREYLGCQIWLEPDDSAERVELLFQRAAETGLGWARLFLIWPWIEEKPGVWTFGVFDLAFAAAQKHGIKIKATLTANSGPWHIGTPSMLHSHTGFILQEQIEPMKRYIAACVGRYRKHPALGQWILWNEPAKPNEREGWTGLGLWENSPYVLEFWRRWLKEHYRDDIATLNKRWMTGYLDFSEVPFAEQVPYLTHRSASWNAYGPYLDESQARVSRLCEEIGWISDQVRLLDTETETCVNPASVSNLASAGIDFSALGAVVERLGASYHPVHSFTFAERADFPALMAAGVRMQASHPGVRGVEVTEVQTGNTVNAGPRACNVLPSEIVRFYLASIAAGAASVTGWCFNIRNREWESGDWGLLDDQDRISDRSRLLRVLHDRLDRILAQTGAWSPAPPDAWIGLDRASQALEMVEARDNQVAGRAKDDGSLGAWMLAARLMELGISANFNPVSGMPSANGNGKLMFLCHILAWEKNEAEKLLGFVESGGTLVLDSIGGRRDGRAVMHRPWPGGLAEKIGLQARGLDSLIGGYDLQWNGLPAGNWPLTRLDAELDPAAGWSAWPELRFAVDGDPAVWERPLGRGRIVVLRGLFGASLNRWHDSRAASFVLPKLAAYAGERLRSTLRGPAVQVIPVKVDHGKLHVVLAPELIDRKGQSVHLVGAEKQLVNLWDETPVAIGPDREVRLAMPEGIAILWEK